MSPRFDEKFNKSPRAHSSRRLIAVKCDRGIRRETCKITKRLTTEYSDVLQKVFRNPHTFGEYANMYLNTLLFCEKYLYIHIQILDF